MDVGGAFIDLVVVFWGCEESSCVEVVGSNMHILLPQALLILNIRRHWRYNEVVVVNRRIRDRIQVRFHTAHGHYVGAQ